MQSLTEKFRQAKNFVKDKITKKTNDDPDVADAFRRFTDTRHEVKDLVRHSKEALAAINATFPLRNQVIEQAAKMGLMGDEKQHVGTEVQNFVVFETRQVKAQQQAVENFQKVVLDGALAVLATVYECKEARRVYEDCKNEFDSAAERVQSSSNKPLEKQQQFQEEMRHAQQRYEAAKQHFMLKCQEVEQKKRTYLKTTLAQYIHHVETGSAAAPSNVKPFDESPRELAAGAIPTLNAKPKAGSMVTASAAVPASTAAPAQLPSGEDSPRVEDPIIDPEAVAAAAQKAPEFVTALYDYDAQSPQELNFKSGQVIKVLQTSPDGWWTGEVDGNTGQFPITYVDLSVN